MPAAESIGAKSKISTGIFGGNNNESRSFGGAPAAPLRETNNNKNMDIIIAVFLIAGVLLA